MVQLSHTSMSHAEALESTWHTKGGRITRHRLKSNGITLLGDHLIAHVAYTWFHLGVIPTTGSRGWTF